MRYIRSNLEKLYTTKSKWQTIKGDNKMSLNDFFFLSVSKISMLRLTAWLLLYCQKNPIEESSYGYTAK